MGLLQLATRVALVSAGAVMLHELHGYWYSRWLFERGLSFILDLR
jgi:hypothetical protein